MRTLKQAIPVPATISISIMIASQHQERSGQIGLANTPCPSPDPNAWNVILLDTATNGASRTSRKFLKDMHADEVIRTPGD